MIQDSNPLTLNLADDIAFAIESDRILTQNLPICYIESILPVVELIHFDPEIYLNGLKFKRWRLDNELNTFINSIIDQRNLFWSGDGLFGHISISMLQKNNTQWTEFAINAKKSAKNVGFGDDYAGKLVGAITELYTNVIEHSQRIDSGQIIFFAKPQKVEFIIRDSGIGVLTSLKQNRNYNHLEDSGTALKLALQDGVSRFADKSGRGMGFRSLLVGMVNYFDFIRFHSGDHILQFKNNNGQPTFQIKQSYLIQGFVCSVSCILRCE